MSAAPDTPRSLARAFSGSGAPDTVRDPERFGPRHTLRMRRPSDPPITVRMPRQVAVAVADAERACDEPTTRREPEPEPEPEPTRISRRPTARVVVERALGFAVMAVLAGAFAFFAASWMRMQPETRLVLVAAPLAPPTPSPPTPPAPHGTHASGASASPASSITATSPSPAASSPTSPASPAHGRASTPRSHTSGSSSAGSSPCVAVSTDASGIKHYLKCDAPKPMN